MAESAIKRWAGAKLAKRHGVDKEVVKRIHAAVASAKKQGLQGGETADLLDRAVGRRLHGQEHAIADASKEHHEHDPPGGYSGPKAKDAPDRSKVDEKKRDQGNQIASLARRKLSEFLAYLEREKGWESDHKFFFGNLADDFEVAADAFEEAGPVFKVKAGTLRKMAAMIRKGDARGALNYGG